MQRVIERLNLVKVDLRSQISELSIRNKLLKDIVVECEDSFEVKLLKEDILDNIEIISDAKLDIEEIDQVIEILAAANEIAEMHKKRP